ncbi:MAG: tRNA (N6-isopentenyl adenosine(37)-C2)-methylthiotransferase MiaB [FCB group bacterium]|jgi:tRNA-2-methylthio-N6-dimethylallyladenosine synthase|nr:tRNA (N6-isopentenyl adenosine(37)-C2)-methylthiotransferase MiaB [FCB group bacterium]
MQKAFIQTYGCQMNEHDSGRMVEILLKQGYEMTPRPEEASLLLVNTCSVRHNPENKVYSLLGRLRRLKERNPDVVIGVGGCVAQQEGETILKREKAVDMVFGPDNFFRLPEMLERVRNGERVLMTKWIPRAADRIQNFVPEEWVEQGHVEGCKAYIAITKGCDNFCTFCIVPYTRGREVSREPENILREARSLVDLGAKEIWLLGQNVNSYRAGDFGFYELLDAVSQVEGLRRVRFTSPHPNDWNNALSDLMAARPTIANQLHLPFQAGSNRILETMNRQHTIEQYLDKVRYMKRVNPALELSTDIIVGYPSETDEEFEETLRVLKRVRFSQVFSFKYSPRPGTKASKLEDDVPREVKEERLAMVIEVQERVTAEQALTYLGSTQEVLIDSAHPKLRNAMNGRTSSFRPVTVRAKDLEIGDIVPVLISETQGHWLLGVLDE